MGDTAWEGTVRVPAFVSGGVLAAERRGKTLDDVTSAMVDWYPTLLSAAAIEAAYPRSLRLEGTTVLDTRFEADSMAPLDGLSLWDVINGKDDEAVHSDSREVMIDLVGVSDCSYGSCGALRAGNWKLVRGGGSRADRRRALTACLSKVECDEEENDFDFTSAMALDCDTESGCLFDLDSDPCELINVGPSNKVLRQGLSTRLDALKSAAIFSRIGDDDA